MKKRENMAKRFTLDFETEIHDQYLVVLPP